MASGSSEIGFDDIISSNLSPFEEIVYSGQAEYKLKIVINDEELENVDDFCEKLVIKSRVQADDGKGLLILNDFVSKDATLTIHQDSLASIFSPNDVVEIYIGTLIEGDYLYDKMGTFNVIKITANDKNKFDISMRDNTVLLDKNYNPTAVIDINNGSATLGQILDDICTQFNITSNVDEFDGDDLSFNFVDSSIKARQYIGYIAEQGGYIPIFNRDGELEFIELPDSSPKEIPLEIIEKYDVGEMFMPTRVLYEDGIRKFEATITNYINQNDTLYIDTANPYITSQTQIDNIATKFTNFFFVAFKSGKILGNPKINPYDFIRIIIASRSTLLSLANNTLTYNGRLIMEFNTLVNKEKIKENVTKTGEATFKRWARTEVDNLNNQITLEVANTEQVMQDVSNLGSTVENQNTLINQTINTLTAQGEKIDVISSSINLTDGKVTEVTTTTGFTFNADGLNIEKSGSPNASTLDESGLEILNKSGSTSDVQLYAGVVDDAEIAKESELTNYRGQSVTYTNNIIFKKYLATTNGRIENVTNSTYGDGIGFFV